MNNDLHGDCCIAHYEYSRETHIRLSLYPYSIWHWRFLLPLCWYGWNIGGASDMRDSFRVRVLWFLEIEHIVTADAKYLDDLP